MQTGQHNHDTQLEEIICEGHAILAGQEKPNISFVAKQLSETHHMCVPYDTLCHHFHGLTKPHRKAHGTQQFMSPEQEQVLVDWIKHLSPSGHPLSK